MDFDFAIALLSFQLGVNGYSFAVNNNGYIMFHPDLRPMVSDSDPPTLWLTLYLSDTQLSLFLSFCSHSFIHSLISSEILLHFAVHKSAGFTFYWSHRDWKSICPCILYDWGVSISNLYDPSTTLASFPHAHIWWWWWQCDAHITKGRRGATPKPRLTNNMQFWNASEIWYLISKIGSTNGTKTHFESDLTTNRLVAWSHVLESMILDIFSGHT